jgi:hypothetical protein
VCARIEDLLAQDTIASGYQLKNGPTRLHLRNSLSGADRVPFLYQPRNEFHAARVIADLGTQLGDWKKVVERHVSRVCVTST